MKLETILSIYTGGPGSGCNPDAGKCGRPQASGISYPNRPENGHPYEIDVWHGSTDGKASLEKTGIFFHTEKQQSKLFGPNVERYRVKLVNPKVYEDDADLLWELENGEEPFGAIGAHLYKALDKAHAAINYTADPKEMIADKNMREAFRNLDTYIRRKLQGLGYDGVLISPNWNGHGEKGLQPLVEVRKFDMNGITKIKGV